MITGRGAVILHLGYPTHAFKAPMIYNPWFEARGIDAIVVPLAVTAAQFEGALPVLFQIENVRGALITMPHKVRVLEFVTRASATAQIAGAANAVRRETDGTLTADMFDGAGFVRGVERTGRSLAGARVLVVGCGGVGSAIAASLAAAGAARIMLCDVHQAAAESLSKRLHAHYPALEVACHDRDPAGYDVVVNATPLGMQDTDPLPLDPSRLDAGTLVGEVVMSQPYTPLLRAAQQRGCPVQLGTDMLFEMIPAYLNFFGFGAATADELRRLARLEA